MPMAVSQAVSIIWVYGEIMCKLFFYLQGMYYLSTTLNLDPYEPLIFMSSVRPEKREHHVMFMYIRTFYRKLRKQFSSSRLQTRHRSHIRTRPTKAFLFMLSLFSIPFFLFLQIVALPYATKHTYNQTLLYFTLQFFLILNLCYLGYRENQ